MSNITKYIVVIIGINNDIVPVYENLHNSNNFEVQNIQTKQNTEKKTCL